MNMRTRFLLTPVVLLLLAPRAFAGTPELQRCMDHVDPGFNATAQQTACENQEAVRQDHRLNTEYTKLLQQARGEGSDVGQALIAAQRQWLGFRDAWCGYESKTGAAPGPDFDKAACLAELTEKQADLIHTSQY